MSMTELCELGTKYGTDKAPWCWGYTKIYAQWVPRDVKTVCELGVLSGASLRMWRDYFPQANVYGVDNESSCMVEGEERIKTACFNAYDLREIVPFLGRIWPIDFFVDDAVHDHQVQIPMLYTVFSFMAPGGVYAIEDIIHVGDQLSKVEHAVARLGGIADWRTYVGKEGYSMVIMRKA